MEHAEIIIKCIIVLFSTTYYIYLNYVVVAR